ncbi:MAG: DUF2752 domain-containing protein [Bacteroidota bacterium]|nr:DUF2752 domain-containing protein [Bacteroidota bacterium]
MQSSAGEGLAAVAPGFLTGPDSAGRRSLIEALIWMLGLVAVGLADPAAPSVIDLCVFKSIGLPGCPGCGLGHAIGFLFRGEWTLAIQSHWLSPFVLAVLFLRIGSLLKTAFSRP